MSASRKDSASKHLWRFFSDCQRCFGIFNEIADNVDKYSFIVVSSFQFFRVERVIERTLAFWAFASVARMDLEVDRRCPYVRA